MNLKGYYNEFDFCNLLNNKFFYQLSKQHQEMLEKIYNIKFDERDFVSCSKSFKTDKADLIIEINKIKKFISIKSGKNNSIHLEPLSKFKLFLKEIGLPQNIIQIYKDYHYGLDKSGNRISVKEYQEVHIEEINLFNRSIDKEMLKIATNRFLFKGNNKHNNSPDAIIYGTPTNFICATKDEVLNYLMNNNDIFNSIHFSSLVLQPWTRNLNYNPKYEYRREYVQVKWHRLEETIKEIVNNK